MSHNTRLKSNRFILNHELSRALLFCQVSDKWDIDQLQIWVEKWQMDFNPGKCEVLHFRRSNVQGKYTVNGRTLNSTDVQSGLGVQVNTPFVQEG